MKSLQKGFTLIELMIVVAIIAILAAIAIPQYQDYITRSQFSETLTITDALKTQLIEYTADKGSCPTNGSTTSGVLPAGSYAGKYVTSVTIGGTAPNCRMVVLFKGAGSVSKPLAGASVAITATDSGGAVSWTCTSAVAAKYKPSACR